MKLLTFDAFELGVLKGDKVVDIAPALGALAQLEHGARVSALIAQFADYRAAIERHVAQQPGVALRDVRVRPPLTRPCNFVCMAVNYMEDGTRSAPAPINAFTKSALCIIGPEETMQLPDAPASVFEGEAELALVIGKRAHKVSADRAFEHVFGYLNFIDGSARGLAPFYQMKCRDTFAPIGPYLVTADEVADPQNIAIKLWVNGELTQDFNTSDMAHNIARCIEWVSHIHPLEPGDILATGTNHLGLSAFQDGDVVELECAGMGRLRIQVRDELERTWERGTRKQRHQRGLQPSTAPQLTGKYAQPHTPTTQDV